MTFAGVAVPSLMIEKRVRRFSPAALAASPHHRALWDVRLLPACTETGEILLGGCGNPECGPTSWSATLGVDLCEHCMRSLARAPTGRVPEEVRVRLAEVAGLFGGAESRAASLALLPPDVAALGAADVVDLLVRIVPVADRTLPIHLAGMLNAPPERLATAVASAWRVLAGWPDAMSELAAERIRGRSGRHNDGNGGRTMRLLTPKRQQGASAAVLDLIAAWRGSLSVGLDSGAALREATITSQAVSRATGIDSAEVAERRREGLFTIRFALDLHRPEARYDAAEIDGIAAALEDRRSVAAAAAEIGVSRHGVEQLVAMRLLDGVAHPFLDARYGERQVSGTSLRALIAALRGGASTLELSDALPLRAAMKVVGGRVKPWGPAFAMLVSGELRFVLGEGDLALSDAIVVDAAAVPLLGTLRLDRRVAAALSPMMSKADAGELLNLNPRATTDLLAEYAFRCGSHERTVPLDAVERLARRHIAVAELAARRGVPVRRALLDSLDAGVPRLGPGGLCRRSAEIAFL